MAGFLLVGGNAVAASRLGGQHGRRRSERAHSAQLRQDDLPRRRHSSGLRRHLHRMSDSGPKHWRARQQTARKASTSNRTQTYTYHCIPHCFKAFAIHLPAFTTSSHTHATLALYSGSEQSRLSMHA